jgi:L-glyceraldehyde 3-phosphate reductase
MPYLASEPRYDSMIYNRVGRSGLKLPAISLGWWYNFGGLDSLENGRQIARRAFDMGVTHFDLANNYGPPPGSAEENFGVLFRQDFHPYRDELIISTKAGYDMWPGPYGEWGSRKYMLASLDASLKRMGLDYVDIFYSHRPDPDTPLEETMGALDTAVLQGKALYAGISSYNPVMTRDAARILREMGTPCLIHQPSYNMFDRWVEEGLLDVLSEEGIGCIVFSPLAEGQLTDRYLNGIPSGARATKTERVWLTAKDVEENLPRVQKLNDLANQRGQSLAQMAIAWVLRKPVVTSALIGASSVQQLNNNLAALDHLEFSEEEQALIEEILKS